MPPPCCSRRGSRSRTCSAPRTRRSSRPIHRRAPRSTGGRASTSTPSSVSPLRFSDEGEVTMGALDGRVAIITGSGRGLGREHALLFAQEGARVVVNDLGGAIDGSGDDRTAAEQVVDEIKAMGGEAVGNADNVADWEGGQRLINTAIEAFGDLHVLVNNAGIMRHRVLVNMTEDEWDAGLHVHLKGHFVPTRWPASYWREQTKAGQTVNAS